MSSTDEVRVHARVRGLVQGVYYRASAQAQARMFGLRGWVRNLPDGSVELVAEGPRGRAQKLIDWCREGSERARVDSVDVSWSVPKSEHEDFEILG